MSPEERIERLEEAMSRVIKERDDALAEAKHLTKLNEVLIKACLTKLADYEN